MKTIADMDYHEWTAVCQGLSIWIDRLERDCHPRVEEIKEIHRKCQEARRVVS